jgi:hypothetical protein
MSSINEHTGACMLSKTNSKAFEDNYDRIFRKTFAVEIDVNAAMGYRDVVRNAVAQFQAAGVEISVVDDGFYSRTGRIDCTAFNDKLVVTWTKG